MKNCSNAENDLGLQCKAHLCCQDTYLFRSDNALTGLDILDIQYDIQYICTLVRGKKKFEIPLQKYTVSKHPNAAPTLGLLM